MQRTGQQHQARSRHQRGFTLIELLIAVVAGMLVVASRDARGVPMVFSGARHFRH